MEAEPPTVAKTLASIWWAAQAVLISCDAVSVLMNGLLLIMHLALLEVILWIQLVLLNLPELLLRMLLMTHGEKHLYQEILTWDD